MTQQQQSETCQKLISSVDLCGYKSDVNKLLLDKKRAFNIEGSPTAVARRIEPVSYENGVAVFPEQFGGMIAVASRADQFYGKVFVVAMS